MLSVNGGKSKWFLYKYKDIYDVFLVYYTFVRFFAN